MCGILFSIKQAREHDIEIRYAGYYFYGGMIQQKVAEHCPKLQIVVRAEGRGVKEGK